DPDLGSWTYEYDAKGRLTAQVDALSQRSEFTYDGLDRRLTHKTRVGLPGAETITNTYDWNRTGYFNLGKLTTAANPAGIMYFDYDARERLTRQAWTVNGAWNRIITTYAPAGQPLSRSFPDYDSISFTYDLAGRLYSIPNVINSLTYNANGQTLTASYANGVNSTFTYSNQRQWLNQVVTKDSANTALTDLTWSRNAKGLITSVTSTTDNKESWTYGYNDLDELTSATNVGDTSLNKTFTYNTVGNMLTNSALGTYTYPTPGGVRPHAPLTAGSKSFTYDANGNMLTGLTRTYTWDGQNRPASLTMPSTTVTFEYGPDGKRIKKNAGSTLTTYYGADVELSGGVWTKYIHPDAKRVGSATTWMHRGHLKTIRAITNAAGLQAERNNYAPYGDPIASSAAPALTQSKGYIGEKRDPETGLMYLNARYYDPVLTMFVSPDDWDPTLIGVGVNRYAYAQNDPINQSDPNGHILGVIGAIGVQAAAGAVVGAAAEAIGQLSETGSISDLGAVGTAAATGAFGGLAGGITGGLVGGLIGKGIAEGVVKGTLGGLVGGAVSKAAQDKATGKDVSPAETSLGAFVGGVVGGVFGGIGGSKVGTAVGQFSSSVFGRLGTATANKGAQRVAKDAAENKARDITSTSSDLESAAEHDMNKEASPRGNKEGKSDFGVGGGKSDSGVRGGVAGDD
ncbi:MAG: RHS repeat-associated core domain-containing protein, partial [Pseudomonadota bacterium]